MRAENEGRVRPAPSVRPGGRPVPQKHSRLRTDAKQAPALLHCHLQKPALHHLETEQVS